MSARRSARYGAMRVAMPPQKMASHASLGEGQSGCASSTSRARARGSAGRLRAGDRDLRIHHLARSRGRRTSHPQPLEAAAQGLHVVGAGRRAARTGRARRAPRRRSSSGRRRSTVRVIGPDMREAPRPARRVDRDAPVGRLVAEDARAGGGDADRAAAVGADGERTEPRRHRRARAAARAARRAVQIPRIAGDAEDAGCGWRRSSRRSACSSCRAGWRPPPSSAPPWARPRWARCPRRAACRTWCGSPW